MDINYLTKENLSRSVVPKSSYSEQAIDLIVERARKLVNLLIEERGHDKPPFLPEEFAPFQEIKSILRANLGTLSAVLLRFHDGFVIKVNKSHPLARQNFSIAHEIGHILFNKLKLQSYIKNIEYRTYNTQATEKLRGKAKERVCDAAATELLMPEPVFKKYLSNFGVSIHSVEPLAHIFRTSIVATAFRIAEVSTEPCITLRWQPLPKNEHKGLRLTRCVGPGRKFRSNANYMPLHTLVKYPSKLQKAYESEKSIKSSKLFRIDASRKSLTMESKGFGHGEHRYVISLAFLNR